MADDNGYPSALAGRVGFLLARAHLVAREKADAAIGKLGLTAKAYGALATVVSDGAVSQQTLSRRIRVDPATIVDVVDSLERSGYIVRKRNPRDRREYALHTTAKGRALFAKAERALKAADEETLREIKSDERRVLMEQLTKIAGASNTPVADDMVDGAFGP